MRFCHMLFFLKLLFFKTLSECATDLDPDQDRRSDGPDLLQAVSKDYQQTIKLCAPIKKRINP